MRTSSAHENNEEFWARIIWYLSRAAAAWGARWAVRPYDLEDLTQSVLLSLLSKEPRLRAMTSAELSRYCVGAIRWAGANFFRKRARIRDVILSESQMADKTKTPEDSLEEASIVSALQQLAPDDLALLEAWTGAESIRSLAKSLGIPESSLRIRLRRILGYVATLLGS